MKTKREAIVKKIVALVVETTANNWTKPETMAARDEARAMMDAYDITDEEVALKAATRRAEIVEERFEELRRMEAMGLVTSKKDANGEESWRATEEGLRVFRRERLTPPVSKRLQ